jgi:hypothetical protein
VNSSLVYPVAAAILLSSVSATARAESVCDDILMAWREHSEETDASNPLMKVLVGMLPADTYQEIQPASALPKRLKTLLNDSEAFRDELDYRGLNHFSEDSEKSPLPPFAQVFAATLDDTDLFIMAEPGKDCMTGSAVAVYADGSASELTDIDYPKVCPTSDNLEVVKRGNALSVLYESEPKVSLRGDNLIMLETLVAIGFDQNSVSDPSMVDERRHICKIRPTSVIPALLAIDEPRQAGISILGEYLRKSDPKIAAQLAIAAIAATPTMSHYVDAAVTGGEDAGPWSYLKLGTPMQPEDWLHDLPSDKFDSTGHRLASILIGYDYDPLDLNRDWSVGFLRIGVDRVDYVCASKASVGSEALWTFDILCAPQAGGGDRSADMTRMSVSVSRPKRREIP